MSHSLEPQDPHAPRGQRDDTDLGFDLPPPAKISGTRAAALVVAGDVVGAYDVFVAGLRETLYGNATALATKNLDVLPAALGDRSGGIGSATMVLDEVLGPRAVDALVTTS